jgi:hypothetical protein
MGGVLLFADLVTLGDVQGRQNWRRSRSCGQRAVSRIFAKVGRVSGFRSLYFRQSSAQFTQLRGLA